MTELKPGDKAPDFTLPRDGGGTISMSDLSGKNVVLYFYPKDNTSGCTIEAVDFTAFADEFAKYDTVVIGMSPDTVKSHNNFIAKQNLSVILASDTEKTVLEAYGVWQEKSMYGRQYMGVVRTTYLIGKDGVVLKAWNKVKAKGHAEAVLDFVKENA